MALAQTAVWEVRTGGSDLNGGAFNAARSVNGVDRTLQDAPFITIDGVTITAVVDASTDTLNLTGVTAVNGHLGNHVQISGGTATAGIYEIIAIPSASKWQLDRSAGTAGQTATGRMGGANASPAFPFGFVAVNNRVWVKAGTYLITSASTNISGGCLSINSRQLEGYSVTRGDQAARPILRASGINTATIISLPGNTGCAISLEIDGQSLVSIRGVSFSGRVFLANLLVRNCTNGGIFSPNMSGAMVHGCGVTGCSTAGAAFNLTGGTPFGLHDCVAWSNTVTGFIHDSIAISNCLAYNNTGATSDGFQVPGAGTSYLHCTAYGNGRDGFNNVANAADCRWINCLAEANVRNGFNSGASPTNCVWYGLGAFGNGTDYAGGVVPHQFTVFTATFSFFVNAAGGDFSLNNNANGGALARGTGYIDPLVNGQDMAQDLGAIQVAAGTGGGGGGSAIIGPGAPGWVL